jgi:hypothetical protein
MSDEKFTVPVGSCFVVKFSFPKDVQIAVVTIQNGSPVDTQYGPKQSNKKGKVTISVTKDGNSVDFNGQLKETETWNERVFSSIIEAKASDIGNWEYQVELLKKGNTETFTETVKVIAGQAVNAKRQKMLDLINQKFPSSLRGSVPNSTTSNLMALAGWTVGKGEAEATKKQMLQEWKKKDEARKKDSSLPDPGPKPPMFATSCGDVLQAMLKAWGSDFDDDGKMRTRGFMISSDARKFGYYVDVLDASQKQPPEMPKPGDILVLREGEPPQKAPYPPGGPAISIAHVCIVVSTSDSIWRTADGGGGALPEQTATLSNKVMKWTQPDSNYSKGVPLVSSVTDNKAKMVDGWVDLDKIPNPEFNSDGSKKAP